MAGIGGSKLYNRVAELGNKPFFKFIKRQHRGWKDALNCRFKFYLTYVILTVVTAVLCIATISFYSSCNNELKDDKIVFGDYHKLEMYEDLNTKIEFAKHEKNATQLAQLEEQQEDVKFKTKFGRYGAMVGRFMTNDLFGYGTIFIFLGLFTVLFWLRQRVYFPKTNSIWLVLFKALSWGVLFFVILAVWGSVLAHKLQLIFDGEKPLMWGGKMGDDFYRLIDGSVGSFGLWFALVLIPIFYGLILSYMRTTPAERKKLEIERRHREAQEAKEALKRKKEEEKELTAYSQQLEREAKENEHKAKAEENKAEDEEQAKKSSFLSSMKQGVAKLLSKKEEAPLTKDEREPELVREETPTIEQEVETPKEERAVEVPANPREKVSEAVAQVKPESKLKITVVDKDKDALSEDELKATAEDIPSVYHKPTIDLLEEHDRGNIDVDEQLIRETEQRIVEVFGKFNIEVTMEKATVGPTITLYEVVPKEGMPVSKIRNREDDIAMALCQDHVRIIPLPGRGTVGIEVPNPKTKTVSMRSMIASKTFQEAKQKMQLPVAIGKTIMNDTFVFDLVKTPHLLIAGATGQGKSVGLNVIITSLLYNKTPDELKLIMVDPKMLEFSIYERLSDYFLTKLPDTDMSIITDMDMVVPTFMSLCQEMDKRYEIMRDAGVRNIIEYNNALKSGAITEEEGYEKMPYIVAIVDEFADLILTAGRKEVEKLISRLAAKARASGIHLILATQRPSVDVIIGVVKANFPARIAFRVFSSKDSQTILDSSGAEQLIGRGDMLYYSGQLPERVQCAFIDTPETERIVKHITQQAMPRPFLLPEYVEDDGSVADINLSKLDSKLREIAIEVVENQNGSTSSIQRTHEVGFNRAGRIMDQLQALGIVGKPRGSKPRDVLISSLDDLEEIFSQYNI